MSNMNVSTLGSIIESEELDVRIKKAEKKLRWLKILSITTWGMAVLAFFMKFLV